MKRAIMWTLLVAGGAILLPAVIFGPNRLYGLLVANESCEGTAVSIQPSGSSESSAPKCYLVELKTDDHAVRMFSSSDQKWSLIVRGERVRVRLVPSPPWSLGGDLWQDAALLGVYHKPQTAALAKGSAVTAKRSDTPNKSRPLVSHTSAAASFLLMAMFVRALRRRRGKTTGGRVRENGDMS
jgi:hypothetical protein